MAAKLYSESQIRSNFFLPPFIIAALKEKSASTGEPMSQHVRDALIQYLKLEDKA